MQTALCLARCHFTTLPSQTVCGVSRTPAVLLHPAHKSSTENPEDISSCAPTVSGTQPVQPGLHSNQEQKLAQSTAIQNSCHTPHHDDQQKPFSPVASNTKLSTENPGDTSSCVPEFAGTQPASLGSWPCPMHQQKFLKPKSTCFWQPVWHLMLSTSPSVLLHPARNRPHSTPEILPAVLQDWQAHSQ
jgi:hypothetical protein